MRELLNELVMVSKIENGRHTLSLETVNILDLFNTVIYFFKPCATKKNVAINFYSEGDFPKKIKIDPLKLKVIIENLVENAVRYTNSGGKIDIFLKIIPNEKIIFKFLILELELKKTITKLFLKNSVVLKKPKKSKPRAWDWVYTLLKHIQNNWAAKFLFIQNIKKGQLLFWNFPLFLNKPKI